MIKKKFTLLPLALVALLIAFLSYSQSPQPGKLKLYWFIPDGVRSEPELFTIFKWAEEGKLPNIKKLMKRGSYGYSKPTFPGHTPTNFATLLTGSYPLKHGVTDGPMHIEGKPLDSVAVAGFRSSARKIKAVWSMLEDTGEKVSILSVPGSTPPEIEKGTVVRGRWGGWGADYHAVNFEPDTDKALRIKQGRGVRLFFFGPQLTQFIPQAEPKGWTNAPVSFSPAKELKLSSWGGDVFALVLDTTDDKAVNYDRVAFSMDRATVFATLSEGDWSDWQSIKLKFKSGEESVDVDSHVNAEVIKLDDDGFFRLRLFYDNLNDFNTQPSSFAKYLEDAIGPMVDFVDNFPPQLVFYDEDKKAFLDEAKMSFDWHEKAVEPMIEGPESTAVIHDVYTPNQMLTSRWWMGTVDPKSARYNTVDETARAQAWDEVLWMYQRLDAILGKVMDHADKNTLIVFSSDHGAVPLDKTVRLNNLFAQKGWLKFKVDPNTGEPTVDWKSSKVIYLQMAYVYINPKGLAGNYERQIGPAYEKLREEVRQAVLDITDDETGTKPVVEAYHWEDAPKFLELPTDRVGDLVLVNKPGYGFTEDMTNDKAVLAVSTNIAGYKQAIVSDNEPGMWTPFIIAGPGIKQGNFMGDEPILHVQQLPTILKALGKAIPEAVDGKPLLEIFK